MAEVPQAGLARVEAILARGDLADYRPAHAAAGELRHRLGRARRALDLSRQEPVPWHLR